MNQALAIIVGTQRCQRVCLSWSTRIIQLLRARPTSGYRAPVHVVLLCRSASDDDDGAQDVAKHLEVAKNSVYRWIKARKLTAHRIGRLSKFQLSEVDEWVRAGRAHEDDEEGGRSKR